MRGLWLFMAGYVTSGAILAGFTGEWVTCGVFIGFSIASFILAWASGLDETD